jgi:hypothetical protein
MCCTLAAIQLFLRGVLAKQDALAHSTAAMSSQSDVKFFYRNAWEEN